MRKLLVILLALHSVSSNAADFYDTNIKGDRMTIGTVKDVKGEFEPSLKMFKWNEEESLRFTFKSDAKFKTDEKTIDNKVKVTNDDIEINYYTEGENMKVVLTFYKKPKDNFYTFYLEGWENFDFWYQPPLTTEEIAQGDRQAEDAAGSYAVYHKTKKDYIVGKTNYGTGKFCHIYRPKAVDKNGDSSWTELNIEKGIYTVKINQDFIDKAEYPVIINDTFGYISIGSVSTNSCWLRASKYTASASGTVTSMSVYISEADGSGGNNYGLGIYNDSSGVFGTNVCNGSGTIAQNTAQWNSINMSGSLVASNVYWLVWEEQLYRDFIYRDTTGSTSAYDSTDPSLYPLWTDNPAGFVYSGTSTFSLYATYTAGGGATPKPAASQILILE